MLSLSKGKFSIPFLTLFSSLSTLICCALPALFVSLGMGAAVAGLTSAFPQVIWLSEHKILVFVISGIMILVAGISIHRASQLPCPIDPALRDECTRARKVSLAILSIAILCFATGLFFSFIAPHLLN